MNLRGFRKLLIHLGVSHLADKKAMKLKQEYFFLIELCHRMNKSEYDFDLIFTSSSKTEGKYFYEVSMKNTNIIKSQELNSVIGVVEAMKKLVKQFNSLEDGDDKLIKVIKHILSLDEFSEKLFKVSLISNRMITAFIVDNDSRDRFKEQIKKYKLYNKMKKEV